MNLSIIIVSWKVKDKLQQNLQALFSSVIDFDFEVFVVDNASNDGTVEMVRENFPQVKLTINNDNLGFAKANNIAIKQAIGDFVLLLNPDMRVAPDTLKNMVAWLKANPQAAVAGCKLINEQGEIIKQVRRFPRLADQLAIVWKLPHLWPMILNKYLRADFDYTKASQVDSIRGSFFMIRKSIIDKVGLLDEQFFIWFEEVDYCQRVKAVGSQVWYAPVAECIDYVGASFDQIPTGVKQKYFKDSMLKYFKKYQTAWQYYLLTASWSIISVFNLFLKNKKINTKINT